jgi:hypothetical protein
MSTGLQACLVHRLKPAEMHFSRIFSTTEIPGPFPCTSTELIVPLESRDLLRQVLHVAGKARHAHVLTNQFSEAPKRGDEDGSRVSHCLKRRQRKGFLPDGRHDQIAAFL